MNVEMTSLAQKTNGDPVELAGRGHRSIFGSGRIELGVPL
jgi:hypothetical protein